MTAKRLFWMCVLLAAAGAVAGLLSLRSSSQPTSSASAPAATWAAGERPAPAFRLRDQNGKGISLAAYRGEPVLITFLDPVCRDFCPLEAKVLADAVARAPASIVAVSANPYGNARAHLLQDIRKWHQTDAFRWAVGSNAQLAPVWSAYGVQVLVTTKKIAGVRVRYVAHTEAAYLVDGSGHERALFVWPYTTDTVVHALKNLG